MSKQELNYLEDCAINLDDLHNEWALHAQIRGKYADEVAHLERVKEQAHEKLKVVRSQLVRDANKDPEKCLGEKIKPTAPIVEAYYRNHPDHKKAKDDLINATYDLSMSWNALKRMDDRKIALENEVKLYFGNYFATPREHRDVKAGKIMDKNTGSEKIKNGRQKINERRKRQ